MDEVKLAFRELETLWFKWINTLILNIKKSNLDLPNKVIYELDSMVSDIWKILDNKPNKWKKWC